MMNTSGYSGTPLIRKLGIKPGMKIHLVNAPANYEELVACDIQAQLCKPNEVPDFAHAFVTTKKQLQLIFISFRAFADKNPNIIIWFSWYKKSANIKTDITEDVIRDLALQYKLVDVKVCAVTEIWSGLKLVVPKKLR